MALVRRGLRDIVAEGSAIPSDSCCRFWGPLTTGAFLISYPDMIPTTGTGMQRGSVAVAITRTPAARPRPWTN